MPQGTPSKVHGPPPGKPSIDLAAPEPSTDITVLAGLADGASKLIGRSTHQLRLPSLLDLSIWGIASKLKVTRAFLKSLRGVATAPVTLRCSPAREQSKGAQGTKEP